MEGLRIVVTGLIGSIPLAGLTLHYLQYVLGLRRLGHDVLYLEDTGAWYYDPVRDEMTNDPSTAVDHLSAVMSGVGKNAPWSLVHLQGDTYGVREQHLQDFVKTADLFLNVTGAGLMRDDLYAIPRRAYIDTDPGYVQLRIASGSERDLEHLRRHTHHFSFGHNIGTRGCSIPEVGFTWHSTRQPIVLNFWQSAEAAPRSAPFTTVLKWQTYDAIEYEGEVYGMKDAEFMKFLDLPGYVTAPLEIAATGKPPTDDLESRGWRYLSARSVSASVEKYRSYIQRSRGEWSVAKSGYVKLHTGWFGDRSASYLASSRPVALQSTGFEEWLPTGSGLVSFSTYEQAIESLSELVGNYSRHSQAARDLAQEFFRSEVVLSALLEAIDD